MRELTEKKADYEEEKKGSKIIKWTPFPTPPQVNSNFSDIQVTSKMQLVKTFTPVRSN